MATSGTIRPSSNGIYIKWSLSSQSVTGNYSVVSITFGWGFHSSPLDRQLDNGILKVNGTTVYSDSGRVKNHTGDYRDRDYAVWSGSRTIYHNSSGNATLTLYGAMTGWEGYRSSDDGSYSLPTIDRFPSAPGTPSVTGNADSDPTTATFTWTAPSDTGSGLTNRQIQVNTASGFNGVDEVNNTAGAWNTIYNATGLPKGKTLYARVRAATVAGWGGWSSTRTFTTGTTAPSTPGTPAASGITGSSMTISWSAPSDNGGSSISSYEVQRADDPSFATGLVTTTLPGSSTSFQVTGLKHTWRYHFRVRAKNAAGATSNWSTAVSFETTATTPTAPTTPAATDRAATSLAVSWSAPSDSGGASITGYEVQWSLSSSFSSPAGATSTSPSFTMTNLTPSTLYYVRTRAVNSVGAGTYSAAAQVRTTSGLKVPDASGTAWREADVWAAVPVPGGYEWRRCLVNPL